MPTHPDFYQGQVVEDKAGEYYIIERFDGEYLGKGQGFHWRIWIRSVTKLAQMAIPASVDELKPVTLN